MVDEGASEGIFKRLTEYFHRSRFDYLAIDLGEASLKLSREPADDARAAVVVNTSDTPLLSASVGFAEAPAGRKHFATRGERVKRGDVLFAVRRFKGVVPVTAPASGTVADVLVKPGEFVAFGQELARVRTTTTTETPDGMD
jgi:biotin carboxyl carrier protein